MDPTLATVGTPLQLQPDTTTQLQTFQDWLEHHQLLAETVGVTDPSQTLKLLLLWGGKEMRKLAGDAGVVQTNTEGGAAADTLNGAIDKIIQKLRGHVNLSLAVYNLMHAEQGAKTTTQFTQEILNLANQCQFDNVPYTKDRAMRDAFIFGTSDQKLRRDALSQDIPYSQLIQTAQAYEQSRNAENTIATKGTEVAKIHHHGRYSGRGEQQRQRGEQGHTREHCPNCPPHYRPHEKGRCPAWGKTCAACRKKGHFAGSKKCGIPVKSLEEAGETDNEYTFHDTHTLSAIHDNTISSISTYTHVVIKLNNTACKLHVDSQCAKTLIPYHMYKQDMGTLRTSNTKFRPYGTPKKLITVGEFDTAITAANGATKRTTVYVVEGDSPTTPLLGEADAVALGILTINKGGNPGMVAQLQPKEVPQVAHIENNVEPQGNNPKTANKLAKAGYQVRHSKDEEIDMSRRGKEEIDKLIAQHDKAFQGIGLLKDEKVQFHIDQTVEPSAAPYRPVPLAYHETLSAHLQDLRDMGKIEDVPYNDHTGWISNVVITEKKNGSIRMNIDMREANKALRHTPRHVETVQEIRHKLKGAKYFSEMDMGHGYHQISLAEESRHISTFRTHEGLHRFKVLFFGASPATDIFHDRVKASLEGLEGCTSIHDNIIVWGKTEEEHYNNLDACLTRLEERGLTLRREKCTFGSNTVKWFGWIFGASGMRADPEKTRAIKEAGRPETCDDVKSFLQAVQFNSRFILEDQSYSQMTLPLRELTHKNAKFQWTEECERAYKEITEAMCNDAALRYFDPLLKTVLITDASPVGISATLYQDQGDKTLKPVDQASRSLTPTETKYSQIERESLAQAWGMESHRYYLLGIAFDTYTDHEPLLAIYNGKKKGNARVERHRIRTQGYRYTMKHIPGKENPCDYASRHPDPAHSKTDDGGDDELSISAIMTENLSPAVNTERLTRATQGDADMQKLEKCIQRGYISNDPVLSPYRQVFTELCTKEGMILRGDRIVIPKSLQQEVIDTAHEGHQGEVKTKQLLRMKCWFPKLDDLVREKMSNCRGCQATTYKPTRDPLTSTPLPDRPWQHLDADFKGPMPTGEYLLVVIDQYSRYPEVEIVSNTSARQVLPKLDKIFATHGFPESLKTDGGPPFNGTDSHTFKQYMQWAGIKHKVVSPDDPEANGLAENFMKNLKKTWNIAKMENKSPQQELYNFLRHYRATPHTTTGKAPAELLFNRPYKTRLPQVATDTMDKDQGVRAHDNHKKAIQKYYKDRAANVRQHNIRPGDNVIIQNKKRLGAQLWYDPDPYQVVTVRGHQVTAQRGTTTKTRDAKKMKKVPYSQPVRQRQQPHDIDIIRQQRNTDALPQSQPQGQSAQTPADPRVPQSPQRHWVRRSTRETTQHKSYNAVSGRWEQHN